MTIGHLICDWCECGAELLILLNFSYIYIATCDWWLVAEEHGTRIFYDEITSG